VATIKVKVVSPSEAPSVGALSVFIGTPDGTTAKLKDGKDVPEYKTDSSGRGERELDLKAGNYIVSLGSLPVGFSTKTLPRQIAVADDSPPFDLPFELEYDAAAAEAEEKTEPWLNWGIAAGVLGAVTYWVTVLVLPASDRNGLGQGSRWVVGLLGVALVLAALAAFFVPDRVKIAVAGRIGLLVGGALVIVAAVGVMNRPLALADDLRFALGVGGVALASLLLGLARFDTIRAVASVPIVVLFIGLVTWPKVDDLITETVQSNLITWMGIILGVSAVGEAAKQVAQVGAEGKVAAAAATARDGGDLYTVALREPPGDLH
jgi:hypothetical protein